MEDLSSKVDNRVGWAMALVIAATGVCVVGDRLRKVKKYLTRGQSKGQIVKRRVETNNGRQIFRARERRLAVDVHQVLF